MTKDGFLPVLTYLRGLAALGVACFHLTNGHGSWASLIGAYGWLGVEIFFVISGFVIPYSLRNVSDHYNGWLALRFLIKRVMRIEPPYVVSIALVICLDHLAALSPLFRGQLPSFEFGRVLAHLFYLVPLTSYDWIQPVYWSLAYEFLYYIGVASLFPLIGGRGQHLIFRVFTVTVLGLVVVGIVPALITLFVMGFAVFRRLVWNDDLMWTIFVILGSSVVMQASTGSVAQAVAGTGTAAAILFHDKLPIPAGRLGDAFAGLGAISYSLYLVHVPIGGKIVNLGRRVVDGPVQELTLSLLALVLSIVVAVIFWLLVERPAASWSRRILFRV